MHAIIRIARSEAPDANTLGREARSAVAVSKIDGTLVEWGEQFQSDAFRADGDGAKTIWYLSKALNYVMKDVAGAVGAVSPAWDHQARLEAAARQMRCSWS